MVGYILKKVFGTRNARTLRSFRPLVARIGELEAGMQAKSDEQLRALTAEYRQRHANGEPLEQLLPEAFATVREAGRRVLNMRHFDVQLMGGMVLHRGCIAEMKTGEGKTLVATLPCYLNALERQGRPRRHRQRLPRPPRRRVDGPHLQLPRHVGGRDRARPDRG